jgi:hypothetical protein
MPNPPPINDRKAKQHMMMMMMTSPATPKLISSAQLASAWNSSIKTTQETPVSPRSATSETNNSTTPTYGTPYDQKVGIEFLKKLETTVPSLKDPALGGITVEALNKAYNTLMGINSTANLSAEQKGILAAATDAWLSQNPSDATKVNDPTQAKTIAKNVADILKRLIINNYSNATIATIRESSKTTAGVFLAGSKEFQTFFNKKLTTAELAEERDKIGTPMQPVNTSGISPSANLGYAQG